VNLVATFPISRLSWLECMVRLPRVNNDRLESEYRLFFEADQLKVVELTPAVIERAASLRARCSLKTPNALQGALRSKSEATCASHERREFPESAGVAGEGSGMIRCGQTGAAAKRLMLMLACLIGRKHVRDSYALGCEPPTCGCRQTKCTLNMGTLYGADRLYSLEYRVHTQWCGGRRRDGMNNTAIWLPLC
jgi:hypothetical protein